MQLRMLGKERRIKFSALTAGEDVSKCNKGMVEGRMYVRMGQESTDDLHNDLTLGWWSEGSQTARNVTYKEGRSGRDNLDKNGGYIHHFGSHTVQPTLAHKKRFSLM